MKNWILRIIIILGFSLNLNADQGKWAPSSIKRNPEFKYFLHTGLTFDVILKTSIFSFNLDTPVICENESDVVFNDKVMLPKGCKFIGYASVIKSLDRVQIVFDTIVTRNGDEIPFTAVALDTFGAAGIKGKVTNVKKAAVPAQILLGAAGSVASNATGSQVAGDAAQSLASEAKTEMDEKQTYSIEIHRDIPIMIFVSKRTEF